jgi:hypothetical protein
MIPGKVLEGRGTDGGVLAGQRTAAHQIPCSGVAGIVRDALPEESDDRETAVVDMDAGPAQFDDLVLDGPERGEVEFLFRVEPTVLGGDATGLEPVGPNDLAGVLVSTSRWSQIASKGSSSRRVENELSRPSLSSRLNTRNLRVWAARRSSVDEARRRR